MRSFPFSYVAIFICAALIVGCATKNVYYDEQKAHHTPEGFKNNYSDSIAKSLLDVAKWKYDAWRNDLPKPPKSPTPVSAPNLPLIQNYPAQAASTSQDTPLVTWIGHATVLVQAGGLNVLTDPIFSERASPVSFVGPKRTQPPGVLLNDLPHVDAVLISHNHADHLDVKSVKSLNEKAKASGKSTFFLVPLGLKPWFADIGIENVIELDWWERHNLKNVEFYLTPVQHWSARGITDRSKTLWGGWAVFAPQFHWYFSGDTGYSKDFADTKARFATRHADQSGGFDLALIPIGAYEPRSFMADEHVNPEQSVKIHQDLGAKRSIGIHWGTFALTDESLDQPPIELAAARQKAGLTEDAFSVMKIGETRLFSVRSNKAN
jgi:N-acyl-phosphatidylethanolamine-hydrolysing phospholipase D